MEAAVRDDKFFAASCNRDLARVATLSSGASPVKGADIPVNRLMSNGLDEGASVVTIHNSGLMKSATARCIPFDEAQDLGADHS
jgi:hypothetical protein